MSKVLYGADGRVARITLNRPEVLNAIDDEIPALLSEAVSRANADPAIHVILLGGAGKSFCAGYDLTAYAEGNDGGATQPMPWDPMKDFALMSAYTAHFMAIWRSHLPVICRVQGHAVAGGSDIALCSDIVLMAEDAQIGYMPARVWGCPTTAMWVYRVGMEQAKRMLLTGDRITGIEAARMGLVLKAVSAADLDAETEALVNRIAAVPRNQLMMQKMVINQAIEAMGLAAAQRLATVFDGIARHSPEGLNFRERAGEVGWKKAVEDRDRGTWDWTVNRPIASPSR